MVSTRPRPLDGVRVLELASLVAAPFCTQLLASFGADVVKVEPPDGGDAVRGWRTLDDSGTSYWWRSLSRNKRLVAVDLRVADGQALVRKLAASADVLVEGFRPGTLEKWGLGPDALWKENAGLVVARVSGFGQTGPYARKPGFAAVAEAWGGLRHLTGMPGEPPVRANLSLGDTLAGLHAALGVLLALRARERDGGRGQVVDVSLVESVLAVLESVIPEHAGAGVVRAPSGTGLSGVVPSDLYPCADGFVVIGANADAVFVRLMRAVGRDDLAGDPALARNPGRVAARAAIDAAITAWTRARPVEDVVAALEAAEVPVGPLRDAAGLARDPHLVARGVFETARAEGRSFVLPAAMPRLERTPARTDFAGGALGADTDAVLAEAGVDAAERARLRAGRRDSLIRRALAQGPPAAQTPRAVRRSVLLCLFAALLVFAALPVRAEPPHAYVDVSVAIAPPPPLPPRPPHRRPPPCRRPPPHLSMPDAPRGRLTLRTRPFAEVTIDGRVVGHTPLVGFWLDPGTHRIVVRADCGTLRKSIVITPSTDIHLALALCGRTVGL